MRNAYLLLLGISLFLFQACGTDSAQKEANDTDQEDTSVESNTTENDNSSTDSEYSLEGLWDFSHEPGTMAFNKDGSFRDYVEAGALDPDSEEETFRSGQWSLEGDQLTISLKDGNKEQMTVVFLSEGQNIYLTDANVKKEEMDTEEMEEMNWRKRAKN